LKIESFALSLTLALALGVAAPLLAASGRSQDVVWLAEPVALSSDVSDAQLAAVERGAQEALADQLADALVVGRQALLARDPSAQAPGNAEAVEIVRAHAAMDEAEKLYLRFKFADAAAAFAETADALTSKLATLGDEDREQLFRARLLEGVCWYEAGDRERARGAFEQLLVLRVDFEPDPNQVSPQARGAFREALTALRAKGVASLELRSDPVDAQVVIDGNPRGRSPLTVTPLPVGRHLVRMTKPGYLPHEAWIEVTPPVTSLTTITLQPTPLAAAMQAVDAATSEGRPVGQVGEALAQVANLGGSSELIYLGVLRLPQPVDGRSLLVTGLRWRGDEQVTAAALSLPDAVDASAGEVARLLFSDGGPSPRWPEAGPRTDVDFQAAMLGVSAAKLAAERDDEEAGGGWIWAVGLGTAGVAVIAAAAVGIWYVATLPAEPPAPEQTHFEVEL